MFKRIFGVAIILVLIWGFYSSDNFGTISGGIALFLFGMVSLSQGFKELTGGGFEKILKKFTSNIWKSMTLGAVGATVMQSSSLVTIIAISFLSADLIPLAQGIAISLGSNIGTTSGAWLMAMLGGKATSISAYAMPIIVFGLLLFIQKTKGLKGFGSILIGIGIVFIGVGYIQTGFGELKNSINLMDYSVEGFKGILLFVLIGMILTLVLQSSHASILLIMAALWSNQVTFENALALTIGANIGTTFTGILGSLNSNVNGKRLAVGDVLSKVTTGIIFTVFIYQAIPIVDLIASLLGFSETDYAFKLAIFHTFFNIVGVGIILPFYGKFISFIERLIPEKAINSNSEIVRNIYLNGAAAELPNTAIISLIKETKHMYENSIDVLLKILGLKIEDLEGIEKEGGFEQVRGKIKIYEGDIDKLYGEKIKFLFGEIMDFSAQVQAKNPEKHFEDFSVIRRANINIVEAVKTLKHIQRNLQRFLKSGNENIKFEYEKIISDLLFIITSIEKIGKTEGNSAKIKILANIEKFIFDNDIINNGKIDELIRNKLITNEMATSLIKDTNYKNEICNKLILASEIVYNRELFSETGEVRTHKSLTNAFGISNKKVEKVIGKFKKRKANLKYKITKEKDKDKKNELKKQLEEINFIIKKYQV